MSSESHDKPRPQHAEPRSPGAPHLGDGAFVVVVLLVIAALLAGAGAVSLHFERAGTAGQKVPSPDAAERVASAGASGDAGDGLDLVRLATTYARLTSDAERSAQVQQVADAVLAGRQDNVSLAFVSLASPDVTAQVGGDVERPSASVIKLLVMACLLDQASQGAVDLQQQLTVGDQDIVDGSGVIRYAGAGSVYTVEELARLMIGQSDNVAANMLIDLLGYDAINTEADSLGLTGTHLSNKFNSDDIHEAGDNYTTASDTARILQALVTGQVGSPELCQIAVDALADQRIDGPVASAVPEGVAVAHKTGWYEGVDNDAAVVFADRPYVLVVLSEGLSGDDSSQVMTQASWDIYQLTNGGGQG